MTFGDRPEKYMLEPFYDPKKSYQENFAVGPFGAFVGNDNLHINEGEPQFQLFGHKLHLPFGIPAGPLVNGKFVKAALDKGFDLPVYKTVRSRQYPCHPWPNVLAVHLRGDLTLAQAGAGVLADERFSEPLSITNSFGVPSPDPDFWQEDLAAAVRYAREGQLVIGSFQGTGGQGGRQGYVADFALTARLIKETGAKILTVNLSCPNEGSSDLLCFDIETAQKVVSSIKDEIGDIPLFLKIAYFENDARLRRFVVEVLSLADGVTAINTIPSVIHNSQGAQALPGPGRLVSGVCGEVIKWAGLDMVARLEGLRRELDQKFIIAGCGGVASAADYERYRQAGADAALSATGAIWNPFLAQEIKKSVL